MEQHLRAKAKMYNQHQNALIELTSLSQRYGTTWLTAFYVKTRERFQHYLTLHTATAEGSNSMRMYMLKLMVERMEKQPYDINQQHDIMEIFHNLNNFPLLQILWSPPEQQQWKAELQHLAQYLQPKH